ncbi:MAG: phosphotransferase [Pseudomonadota bacterium]
MAFDPDLRDGLIVEFLANAGWGDATRESLGQDASTRRYERLTRGAETAMLMDAPGLGLDANPPCAPDWSVEERLAQGWNAQSRLAASRVDAFAALSNYLVSAGYSAPKIIAMNADDGLAIIEDLGDDLYARVLESGGDETELYAAAGALLADLHNREAPSVVTSSAGDWPVLDFDRLALKVNADLFAAWMPLFEPNMRRDDAARQRVEAAVDDLIDELLKTKTSLVLRDYHAENLIWLPKRVGAARVGLLDFQDAVRGPRIWDWSMLLHDARRDVSEAAKAAATHAYLDASGGREEVFNRELAVAGALNTLRILGVFARLVKRDGRDKYLSCVPREWRHLADVLSHPVAADLAAAVDHIFPDWRERAR